LKTIRNPHAFNIVLAAGIILVPLLLGLYYFFFVDCTSAMGQASCTRVLFIGNSYTYVNDLPGTLTKLARAGGHKLITGMAAPGGWSLARHLSTPETLSALSESNWDFVVLQEQSQLPSTIKTREQYYYPAVRTWVKAIRATNAKPVLFMTWAHQNGWPEMGMPDYESMQIPVIDANLSISKELRATIAPVGYAWLMETRQNPQLELFNADGSHPDVAGTYLAACVFYATLFDQSPVGLLYFGGLPASTARELQLQAEATWKTSNQWDLN
jgi:hypothetical protein